MTTFWLGYTLGILTLLVIAVWFHVRAEKAKRQTFEREIAAAEAKYPTPVTKERLMNADADIEALRDLRSRVLATDGPMTDAQDVELDGILKRLEAKGVDIGPLLKEPIRPLTTQPAPKGVH